MKFSNPAAASVQRSTLRSLRCAGLSAAALLSTAAHAAIAIDGQTDDWASVPLLAAAEGQNARSLKVSVEAGHLYVVVQGQNLSNNYNLFLDTDGNAATGHQSHLWAGASGADYVLSGGTLYRSTGAGWSWAAQAGDVNVTATGAAVEIKVGLAGIGLSGGATGLSVGFQALTAAWGADSVLPVGGRFASHTAAASPRYGKGVIIPAYIPLDDALSWNQLKEGAALMAKGKNPAARDYWVAVNSGNNGPFTQGADWTRAATVWNPIRTEGGKIFGYVHTCMTETGPLFRPLDAVKRDVTAWVQGYPQLDGIWIDEFYPRYELAGADGVTGPTYPNGVENAPTDRGFVNSLNQFNGVQADPSGGYYDQLVKWIRATYPGLRIIGNAGGAFYSNQLRYADLPDVLVSFEQNFETAANAPVNDWANLRRQVPDSKSGQLALIHRNGTSLTGAVDQAFSRGYTHVYTTNRLLESNIWGGLPPYLMSEIQYIADRP